MPPVWLRAAGGSSHLLMTTRRVAAGAKRPASFLNVYSPLILRSCSATPKQRLEGPAHPQCR